MPRTAKLYGNDGKLVAEFELPSEFQLMPPDVIFYGNRAFRLVLGYRGEYSECGCWRAPEPSQVELTDKVG